MMLVGNVVVGRMEIDSWGFGDGDEELRLKCIFDKGPGFEELGDFVKSSEFVCFSVSTDVDQVFVKIFIVSRAVFDPRRSVTLDPRCDAAFDPRHNVVLQLFSRTVFDPAIFDDSDLLRLLVHHLECSGLSASRCVSAKIVEQS